MNGGKYDALDVANYIVNYSIDEGTPVSNLKLQKLLYYVQAASVIEKKYGYPMFQDEICAWTYGPVVENVYHEFKSYANMVIDDHVNEKITDYGFGYDDNYDPVGIIDENDGILIQRVVNSYRRTSPLEMVRKTHNEMPWKNAYSKGELSIEIKKIKEYYQKHRDLVYGK